MPLTLKQLHVGNQCGTHQQAAITVINRQDQLRKMYHGLHRKTMGQHTDPPTVNFNKHIVLQIDMGQRLTAGYSISIDKQHAELINDTLIINTHWHEPAKGNLLAQVLTRPCLLVQIPLIKFNSVRVLDQAGKERIKHLLH